MTRMHNPPHPGETLREDVLPALGLTVTQAAQELGINRVTLSRVVNGKAGISVDLALRLEAWLDGPSAESWLKGQIAYDLWQAGLKGSGSIIPHTSPKTKGHPLCFIKFQLFNTIVPSTQPTFGENHANHQHVLWNSCYDHV